MIFGGDYLNCPLGICHSGDPGEESDATQLKIPVSQIRKLVREESGWMADVGLMLEKDNGVQTMGTE